jgi:tetratricopeptide (TPR) repeat protein
MVTRISIGLLLLLATGLGSVSAVRHLRAWGHARDADRALAQRDLAGAREHLARCLEIWPNSAPTHFLAARTARRLDLYDEAEEHLTRCQQLGGDVAAIKLEHKLARAQRGDWTVEQELVDAVDHDHPDAVLILEALTKGSMKNLSYARVMRTMGYLQQWLERDPDAVPALIWRGQLRCLAHDYVGGEADLKRALELDPENVQAHGQLAEALREGFDPATAAEHYEQVLRRQPEDATALLGLARCRRDLGQADQAIPLLDTLLRQQPDNAAAMTERGGLAMDQRQPTRAEPWLRRAVRLNPYDSTATRLLAACLLRLERQRSPTFMATAPWLLVHCWLKQLEARAYQAKSQQMTDDAARLQVLLPQVLQKGTHDPGVAYEIGMIYMRFGQWDEARDWFGIALSLDKYYQPAREAIQRCQRMLNGS